ncbi:MAG TPA: S-adenosylmethionine:tRNA ribosyltransferase-isomerase [Rubrobacter sp.]|nr:S-adenosylmethionine:tRNA ribosyltransferase-isomerase [Rubrobacter sp.]
MTDTITGALETIEAFNDFPESGSPLRFELPPELEAGEPPEARGLRRDEVRLMVSYLDDDRVVHSRFRDIPDFLEAGDTLVVNTSGTMNAALPAEYRDGTPLTVHLSTHLPADLWVVELRSSSGDEPVLDGKFGEALVLPEGASIVLHTPYLSENRQWGERFNRLWLATLNLPVNFNDYLERHGSPIRYRYVRESWPSSYYQTVYATEVGSAEMPSAGRAFTPELITRLVAKGVQVVPLILHTGVASLEDDEPPYEEFYRVPPETARAVNTARTAGRRVVAVGTTVVRALETVTDNDGVTHPGEGWTDLFITPERGVRSVDAMLTGLHEPRSTHLSMLEALVGSGSACPLATKGRYHLKIAYSEALEQGYLWHEFGDLHLILPDHPRGALST